MSVVVLFVSSYSKTTIETFAASLKKVLMRLIINIWNNLYCLDMGSLENGADAKKLHCKIQVLQ